MKTKKTTLILILLMAGLFLSSHKLFPQQTASQLYEKALYLEEARGELQGAIDIYNQIAETRDADHSIKAKALLHMGMCYEKLGSEKARLAYRDVINRYPEQAEEAAIAQERMTSLDAYLAELNTKAEQHMRQGNELFKRWEYEEAIKEYEDAITLRPNTLLAMNAQYSIGHSLYRAGNYEDAMATFTNLMEENPESNIAPVTELMVSQVQYAMENHENLRTVKFDPDENTIVDPKTGIKYIKTKSFSGRNDIIESANIGDISPDGRFIIGGGNMVVPLDGSEAFKLVDMEATRSIYSPDMKNAAFYADSAIWLVPVDPETGHSTGSPVKLLEGTYRWNYKVSWSPDGSKFVFQRIDDKYAGDIWTISIKDGSLTAITDEEAAYRCPIWSPDGRTIAYLKNREVWLSSAEGGESKKIIDFGGVPFWSPDGKWLFHSSWELNKLFHLSDNKSLDLITPKEVGALIAFSPDVQKMIFYRSSYEINWGFKVVSSSGGPCFEPVRDFDVYGGSWSPDGKIILAQGEDEYGDIIFRVVPFGGEESRLLNIEANVNGKPFPFEISRDHKKLAFTITQEDGSKDIYMVPISAKDARTTGPANLVFKGWSAGAYNVMFSWSADGSKIALIHENDIWIVPLTGGNPVRITNTPEGKRWVQWSPDGEFISYYGWSNATRSFYIMPAEGDNSKMVLEDWKKGSASWSPDSKTIAVHDGKDILIMTADGQVIRKIFDNKNLDLEYLTSIAWNPSGTHLAFIGYSPAGESRLFIIPEEGDKVTEYAPEDKSEKYFISWSPDGKWLSYCSEETVKVRPEGTMWEADFDEMVGKLLSRE